MHPIDLCPLEAYRNSFQAFRRSVGGEWYLCSDRPNDRFVWLPFAIVNDGKGAFHTAGYEDWRKEKNKGQDVADEDFGFS